VETDAHGRVVRFVEKPQPGETASRNASAGTYVLESRALDRMPGTAKQSIEREVFPRIVGDGALWAMSTDDYWIDAGRPETYLAVNLRAASRNHKDAIAQGAHVESGARVSNSVVDEGAVIQSGAEVEDSVVLSGAFIGASCRVSGSIVMGRIERDASVHNAVIGRDGIVLAGSTCSDVRIPENNEG